MKLCCFIKGMRLLLISQSLLIFGCSPSPIEDPFSEQSKEGSSLIEQASTEPESLSGLLGAQKSVKLPVRWTSAFSMVSLLDKPDEVALKSQEDLSVLIEARWYVDFEMENSKSGDAVFTSCTDYFENATERTSTSKYPDRPAFLELKVMCETTRLLQNAKPSSVSYLPDPLLSLETPYQWPKDFAFVISNEQKEQIDGASEVTTWAQFDPELTVELIGPFSMKVRHSDDVQDLEVLGFGDMNGDGAEDMLTVVRDHVVEGSLSDTRLFLMTRNNEGVWSVIKKF